MATATLAARVAQLEKTVAQLMDRHQPKEPGRDDWKKSVGMFDGDEVMKRIIERGAAIRRAESRKTRKLKTLSMAPLRGLPANLSVNTKDKVRNAIAQRHAANR